MLQDGAAGVQGTWGGCGGDVQVLSQESPRPGHGGCPGEQGPGSLSVCATEGAGTDMSLLLCPALTPRCPWWGTGSPNLSGALQELWLHEHCSALSLCLGGCSDNSLPSPFHVCQTGSTLCTGDRLQSCQTRSLTQHFANSFSCSST